MEHTRKSSLQLVDGKAINLNKNKFSQKLSETVTY